jgi:hypothetical protein
LPFAAGAALSVFFFFCESGFGPLGPFFLGLGASAGFGVASSSSSSEAPTISTASDVGGAGRAAALAS